MDHTYQNLKLEDALSETDLLCNDTELIEDCITEKSNVDKELNDDDDIEDSPEMVDEESQKDFYTKLIQLVKSYPNLYDKFDQGFKSQSERLRSWTKIAKAMDTSIPFAQRRWTRLRERFAKERKALDQMQKSGNVHERKRLWPYFLPLLFLSSHVKSRRKAGSVSGNDASGGSKSLPEAGENTQIKEMVVVKSEQEVEIIGENHTEKKRKKDVTVSPVPIQIQNLPSSIVAKPDGSLTTVYLQQSAIKNNDLTDDRTKLKLSPGIVLIRPKGPNIANKQIVLLPSSSQPVVSTRPTSTLPTGIVFQSTPSQISSKDLPIPNSAEHHFGMLIAKELERCPHDVRIKKKQKILSILYE